MESRSVELWCFSEKYHAFIYTMLLFLPGSKYFTSISVLWTVINDAVKIHGIYWLWVAGAITRVLHALSSLILTNAMRWINCHFTNEVVGLKVKETAPQHRIGASLAQISLVGLLSAETALLFTLLTHFWRRNSLHICYLPGNGAEKAMAPHSSALAWKIPRTEEPGRPRSTGSLKVRHDWATSLSLFTSTHWRRKWQPTPVFLPGESQGRGAWWAAVCGASQGRTWLQRLSSSGGSVSGRSDLGRKYFFCCHLLPMIVTGSILSTWLHSA